VGDQLEVVRTGRSLRVRGIHAYGSVRSEGRAGHSTALNVAGADRDEVTRGDVVASPGVFRSTRFIAVDYEHVDDATPLRHRHPVRVHAGTAEALGRAALLDAGDLSRGGAAPVQLRLDEVFVVAPGDRLLVRDAASMVVLGGGVVLEAGDGRLKRFKDRVLDDLRRRRETLGDPLQLALAIVAGAGARGMQTDALAVEVGCPQPVLRGLLDEAVRAGDLHAAPGEFYLAAEAVAAVADELVAALKGAHRKQPLMDWIDLNALRSSVSHHGEAVLQAALSNDPRLETASGGRVRRRGHTGRLTPELEAARDRIVSSLAEAGSRPPDIDADSMGLSAKDLKALLDMLRGSGEVVSVDGLLFHAQALARMERQVVEHGRAREGSIVIPELRDELGTTRKYLIPLLEHFDARGLTVRHGDQRMIRKSALDGPPAEAG